MQTNIPQVVRTQFKNTESFTCFQVTKAARAQGMTPSRGVVATALWRMALSGELYVANNIHHEAPQFHARSLVAYWTGGARRIFTWNTNGGSN